MREHDEAKLPKWAQERLADARWEIEQLKRKLVETEKAHDTLRNRDWLTIPGPPPSDPPLEVRKLWLLNNEHPFPVCTLGKDDLLLIGRRRRDPA